MPNVAAYIGSSVVSILIEDNGKIELIKVPFVYGKSSFSNLYSEPSFYKLLIEDILKRRNLSLGVCKISIVGIFDSPNFAFAPELSTNVVDTISAIDSFYPIFCTSTSVITKDIISSYSRCSDIVEDEEDPTCAFLSNKYIFPHIVPSESSIQIDIDRGLCEKVEGSLIVKNSQPIIFTGDRFSQNTLLKSLNYVLMINLLKSSGIYPLFIDTNNSVFLNKILQDRVDIFSLVKSVGTFISSKGSLECLLSNNVGSDQFFEVEKNSIYIMPLNYKSPSLLTIKGHDIGNKKINVSGGKVGLIFDTREQKVDIYTDTKLFNTLSKDLSRILVNKK